MPLPYKVVVKLESDNNPHPTADIGYISSEADEEGKGWLDWSKEGWREALLVGVEDWKTTAGPACCELPYIQSFIKEIKKHLPEELPWAKGDEKESEGESFKDW